MTKKELYTLVANGTMNDEVMTAAQELLDKYEAEADSRKAKSAEKRAEKTAARLEAEAPVLAALLGALSNTPKTAAQLIAEAGVEVTTQKLAMMFREPVASGKVVKEMIKGEKGKVIGYKLA